jgi:AcrR family transcriptional regulator
MSPRARRPCVHGAAQSSNIAPGRTASAAAMMIWRASMKPLPLTAASAPPLAGPKARMFRLLIDEALALLTEGQIPSVAEVANRAGVSRATAYRYFPSRSKLITAVVEHSLGPVHTQASTIPDGRARIRELFIRTFPRFKEYEAQLRAALQLSLEHAALERAGKLTEEPYRRGHRIQILSHAAAPLKPLIGKKRFDRLVRALSVIYGIEAYVVLRDIWGTRDKEIEGIARWIADALVDTTLAEAAEQRAFEARAKGR